MKKIFLIILTAVLLAVNIANGIYAKDTIPTVSSNDSGQEEVAELPVMPEISKDDFNAQMQRMVDEINEANGITENELSAETAISYPASYDPRTTGKVAAVSNQGNWGLCWVYSAIAMTEQNLIKRGYETSSIDLSELHATYFDYKARNVTCPFTTFCNIGGTEGYIIGDFIKGIGPVYESTVPMQTITDTLTLDDSLMYQHLYEPHKSEGTTIGTDTTNLNAVKRLITDYGAVMSSMYMYAHTNYLGYASSLNEDMTYYLSQNVQTENHAITIVGWDDNYSASNFKTTPPGNGAWLVKQSYGTNAERNGMGSGYMWISYYDGSINGVEAAAWEFTRNGQTPKTITLSASSIALTRGKSTQLTATVAPTSAVNKSITWNSDNEAVATVDQSGLVTAVGKGSCNITVKSVDGYAKTVCPVTVSVLAESIIAEDITLVKGQKSTLYIIVKPDEANDRSYKVTSSDSSIVSVSGKEVTALAEGTTTLTIEALDGSGVKKEIKATVLSDVVLDIQPDGFGDTITIEDAKAYPDGLTLKFKVTANTKDALNKISASMTNTGAIFLKGQGCIYEQDSDGKYGYQVYIGFESWAIEGETDITVESSDALNKKSAVHLSLKKTGQANNPGSGQSDVSNPSSGSDQGNSQVTDPCAYGHDYQTVTKKASTSADGYTQKQCIRCGAVAESRVIPKASEIYLSAYTMTYTGKALRPKVSVFDREDNNITGKCRVTYSSNKKVGKAKVKISCNTSEYSFTTYTYFTIVPKKTSIKKAVKDASTMTVTWKKQSSQTDGYVIQYSTKSSFTKSTTKTVKVKGNKTTEKTIKKLNAKKKYYVRIRTYKKVGSKTYYSDWSKAVKTK